jgi:hypothetical protein
MQSMEEEGEAKEKSYSQAQRTLARTDGLSVDRV